MGLNCGLFDTSSQSGTLFDPLADFSLSNPLAEVAAASGGAGERARPGAGPEASYQGIATLREIRDCLAEHSAVHACHALSTWALVFVHGPRARTLDGLSLAMH